MKKHGSKEFLSRRKFLIDGGGVAAGISILNEGKSVSAKPQGTNGGKAVMDSSALSLTLTVRPTVLLIQKEKEVP